MTIIEIPVSNDPVLYVIERTAADLAGRGWVPFEDLYQEGWVWRLSHPVTVQALVDEGGRALDQRIRGYLTEFWRREKAAVSGYSVDDEAFYTPETVAKLLPLTLDIEAALISARDSDSDGGRVRNPHGQGDFLTSLIDVSTAWTRTKFRGSEARLIEMHFCDGMEYEHIAGSTAMSVDDVKKRIAVGLRRMVNHLGGWPGRACPADCPDCIERAEL